MKKFPFHHPFRVDAPTLLRAKSATGYKRLLNSPHFPEDVRFLAIDPTIFVHTYLLLGEQPQRFTQDLSLYLSTVRTFFERADASGGIAIPSNANSDSRRRLSEDLGVALAAIFMVEVFGLTWESISQIPQNSNLSKKRPDFQGYSSGSQRYLFEAKGTIKLARVESSLSKAISQVKKYPELAEAKIAIVSYLCADDRFFPSTSFVVDPPAMPENVRPEPETARLLHFEKILQFANLANTADEYTSTLSHVLREKGRSVLGIDSSSARSARLSARRQELIEQFEIERATLVKQSALDVQFTGRQLTDDRSGLTVFFGAGDQTLEAGVSFEPFRRTLETRLIHSNNEVTSIFADGTILRIFK